MQSSRSKRGDPLELAEVHRVNARLEENSKGYGGLSSFFSRTKRSKSPVSGTTATEVHGSPSKLALTSLQTPLGSKNYRALSRSMNDLGSLLMRTEVNSASEAHPNSAESETISPHRPRKNNTSPIKHKSKKMDPLSAPVDNIVKEGWLNRRSNKKEHNMKLCRVFLRDSKLYAYKPPPELMFRSFELDSSQSLTMDEQFLGTTDLDNLQPEDFPETLQSVLFRSEDSGVVKLFYGVDAIKETNQPNEPLVAFTTSDSILICGKRTSTLEPQKFATTHPTEDHSMRSNWYLYHEYDLKTCVCSLSNIEKTIKLRENDSSNYFIFERHEFAVTFRDRCAAQQLVIKENHDSATESATKTVSKEGLADSRFNAIQLQQSTLDPPHITRNEHGDILSGTVSGLCRQILSERDQAASSSSPSHTLLSTLGLWHSTSGILLELCSQVAGLENNAHDYALRIYQIVQYVLETASSLLLDSNVVEGLLKLIQLANPEVRSELQSSLWDQRSKLLAVISMDPFEEDILPRSGLKLSDRAEFQAFLEAGLESESILAIPANVFAEQLHIFHLYYLKRWNPVNHRALFYSTSSKGASRNPLVFGSGRMHFLTNTILKHVLQMDARPLTHLQRSAICTQWTLIGIMLKRLGDMAGWMSIVMALCAPAVTRLKTMWSLVENRLRSVVEREWSPVMRDLFRRTDSSSSLDRLSAHVLAPDTNGSSISAEHTVPFYGDLCDAIELVRQNVLVDTTTTTTEVVDLLRVGLGRDMLDTAFENYLQSLGSIDSDSVSTEVNHDTIIPAIQDCFKQMNSIPIEMEDVCSPRLLHASLHCEPDVRVNDLVKRKESLKYSLHPMAFAPLVFTDLLPAYRLFDTSAIFTTTDPARRHRLANDNVPSVNKISGSTAIPLRRLNSFPPTQRPSNYATDHDYLDETTKTRAAASVSRWKMLKHVKDLAGASDKLVTFTSGHLILNDIEDSDKVSRRRPQSVLVDARKRDSTISRRSSLQFTDTVAPEPEEDLVVKPHRAAHKLPGKREFAIKAATLEVLIDLLILEVADFRGLQIASASDEHLIMSSIALDRPEYMRTFLISYRSYCTPTTLITALTDRFLGAATTCSNSQIVFPSWRDEPISHSTIKDLDWALLDKVHTGIFEVLSTWLDIASGDFTSSCELLNLFEQFLIMSEAYLRKLDSLTISQKLSSVCINLCTSNLKKLRRQFLQVRHRPQSWAVVTSLENGAPPSHSPFSLARITTLDEEISSVRHLHSLVESVAHGVVIEDWMHTYELFENQTVAGPKSFFAGIRDISTLDHEIDLRDSLWLVKNSRNEKSSNTLREDMPLPIQRLIDLRVNIATWTTQQITDHTITQNDRIHRIQMFLRLIGISCVCMSSLDIKLVSETVTTTQIVPTFVANAISAGLIDARSRLFVQAWNVVSQMAGKQESTRTLLDLVPEVEVPEPQLPSVPCIAWLFDRMLEVACYIPDKSAENSDLLNFDKRRYIYNLLFNLELLEGSAEQPMSPREIDNPYLFLVSAPVKHTNWKITRQAAQKENQAGKGARGAKPFSHLVQLEHEKTRRDIRFRDLLEKHTRETEKAIHRRQQEGTRSLEQSKRPSARSRYSMNNFFRAVRPISVAMGGSWPQERSSGAARTVTPKDLPNTFYIAKGTKPSLTIDLVSSSTHIVDFQQNLFHVITEDGMENIFQATSTADMEDWNRLLNHAASAGAEKRRTVIKEDEQFAAVQEAPQFSSRSSMEVKLPSATFGVDLALLVRRDASSIPRLVTQLIDEVERRGLQEVGIYRISGSLSTIVALKRALDSGRPVDLGESQWSDINAVAGVFKLWLRELPEPLMTYALYDKFLDTLSIEDYNTKSLCLKELVHQLPVPNFSALKRLIEHLEKVTYYESTNHMYAHNLAIIFGPNILQPLPSNTSFVSSMNDLGKVQTILRNIILQCRWMFSTEEPLQEEQNDTLAAIKFNSLDASKTPLAMIEEDEVGPVQP